MSGFTVGAGFISDFQIQAIIIDQGEHLPIEIKAVAAKHAARIDWPECGHLLQHEVDEVLAIGHDSWQAACGLASAGPRYQIRRHSTSGHCAQSPAARA